MSYEVLFQHEGAEYTVRGPDIDGVLRLIQGVQTITKPADDGWVEWNGGNLPVAAHCEVEIVCREGSTSVAFAYRFDWAHRGHNTDIVRYRVCA